MQLHITMSSKLNCLVIYLTICFISCIASRSPSDFKPQAPVTHTIDLNNTLPENRWKDLFESKCVILKQFVPTQMALIERRLNEKWNASFDSFRQRLFLAYQEVSWLRDSDFLKEITSISEGCLIDLAEMIMLNYVYDIFGGGCTSIVFNDSNGSPQLASNLDFDNGILLAKLTVDTTWIINNKPAIKSNQIFGYYGYTRGMKLNMFAMATNSRYEPDESKNDLNAFFKHLYSIKDANANMTVLRDNFEKSQSFAEYVVNMSESFTVSPAYYIISGINKNEGVVIEKNSGNDVREFTWLNESNKDSYKKLLMKPKVGNNTYFVVQTNMDRDTLDIEKVDPRRYLAQQKMLSLDRNTTLEDIQAKVLRQNVIFQTESAQTANTSLMDAKKNTWILTSWILEETHISFNIK